MGNQGDQISINVVGAGPGGLTAAMLLANRGFKVRIFEKSDQVGGRNAAITKNGYKFDVGPTGQTMVSIGSAKRTTTILGLGRVCKKDRNDFGIRQFCKKGIIF